MHTVSNLSHFALHSTSLSLCISINMTLIRLIQIDLQKKHLLLKSKERYNEPWQGGGKAHLYN